MLSNVFSGTLDNIISNHLPVFWIKNKQKLNSTSSFIKARSFINYNKQSFQEDIRYHPKWINFWDVEPNKPEEMWEMKVREGTPQWIT